MVRLGNIPLEIRMFIDARWAQDSYLAVAVEDHDCQANSASNVRKLVVILAEMTFAPVHVLFLGLCRPRVNKWLRAIRNSPATLSSRSTVALATISPAACLLVVSSAIVALVRMPVNHGLRLLAPMLVVSKSIRGGGRDGGAWTCNSLLSSNLVRSWPIVDAAG